MAFIMPLIGYNAYRLIKGKSSSVKRDYTALFTASYIAVNVGALFAALEFGLQPLLFRDSLGNPLYCPYGLNLSLPAMMIPHLLIVGFVEGIFTTGVYAFVKRTSPEAIYKDSKPAFKPFYILLGLMIALCPLGLIASGTAWGEWSADELYKLSGYVPEGLRRGFSFKSILPGYSVSGLNGVTGYILCAVFGVVILLIMFKIINMLNHKKSRGRG
jgi:cobalt/nickel transport system permease protein